MRKYLAGEAEAFERLYALCAPRVHAYLKRRLPSRQDADDLLQAVFFKFHRSRHQFDFRFHVLQFLFVIARTAVLDFQRAQGRQLKPVGPSLEEAPSVELPWEELSDEQRQALEWRYLDELSYQDIATRLSKSEEGVRQSVSRALRKMRTALGN